METLKDFFKTNKITQAEAAKRLGITQAAVSNHINNGGMTLKTAMAYNTIIGVPIEILTNNKPQTDKE